MHSDFHPISFLGIVLKKNPLFIININSCHLNKPYRFYDMQSNMSDPVDQFDYDGKRISGLTSPKVEDTSMLHIACLPTTLTVMVLCMIGCADSQGVLQLPRTNLCSTGK